MFKYPKDLKTIHKFQFMGERFVYDVNSVSVFKIDKPTWDILDLAGDHSGSQIMEKLKNIYPKRQITRILSDLERLEEAGEFFSLEPPPNSKKDIPFDDLVLQIAHDCDLRCKYCFAGHGRYRGSRALMDARIGERAVDLFIKESGVAKDLTLSFFGGEPLLNLKLIKHLVPYARSQAKRYGKTFKEIIVVTNGILLNDSVVKYFDRNKILLKVSLDGPREIHDEFRTLPCGGGSHDLILTNLERVKGTDLLFDRTTLQATYCSKSLEISRAFSYLLKTGFNSIEIGPAYLPMDNKLAIRKEHLPKLKEEYGKIGKLYLERLNDKGYFVFGSFERRILRAAFGRPKFNECRAAEGTLTVSPDGSIFPCFELDGYDEYRMGDIFEGVNIEKKGIWLETCYVDSRTHCRDCWARYLCGGGCRAHSIKFNKDILQPFEIECELKKLQFEVGMWLWSESKEEDGHCNTNLDLQTGE